MGRAPCCDKKGMKKGPWTPEEDQILISYIHQHGHSNWRALPKQAGLLRCGKSCRLRWVNYLSPDIKRGNFGPEEEEAIIKLHEMLGNRWSAIAARLPGRTDNEIKNVWHTHLKKRVNEGQSNQDGHKIKKKNKVTKAIKPFKDDQESNNFSAGSPQQSTTTATTTTTTTTDTSSLMEASSMESFPEIDESFWTESLSVDDFEIVSMVEDAGQLEKLGFEELGGGGGGGGSGGGGGDGEMDFWYNVFFQSGGFTELPEF